MAAKNPPSTDKFIEGLEMGMIPVQAAGYAGYKNPAKSSRDLLAKPEVMQQFDAIKERIRAEARITRKDIEEGILDAIGLARLQADAMGMIRGYSELNKMQGNYAPEKRQIELSSKQRRVVTQLEELTEQQLLEMVSEAGDEMIVDAEYYEVDEDDDDDSTSEGDDDA